MILFKEDWDKYPTAIVHTSTKNKSWLKLASKYKAMGVENYYFHLALINPLLENYDPRDPNLPTEVYSMMHVEASMNPWYALREGIIVVPTKGSSEPSLFLADRGNIAFFWCVFNCIVTYLQQIRQTGKSLNLRTLITIAHHFLMERSQHVFYTKSDLRAGEIAELKAFRELLPYWAYIFDKEEADNQISFTTKSRGNETITYIPSGNPVAAGKVARGKTPRLVTGDEIPFCSFSRISIPAMVASTARSFEDAARDGLWHAIVYTTTAGDLSTPDGLFVYEKIKRKAAGYSESMLDFKDRAELVNFIQVTTGELDPKVDITFNHLQLGLSDDWLKRVISRNPGSRDEILRDHLNIWTYGSSSNPIPEFYREKIKRSQVEGRIVIDPKWKLPTKFYLPEEDIQSRTLVAAVDMSDAVGKDNITIVAMDVETTETVFVCTINNCNLTHFVHFLVQLLEKYPKLTLIPEDRFNWKAIQDQLLILLPEKGIDPGRRIYSRVVDQAHGSDREKETYKHYSSGYPSEKKYRQYRERFGFPTNGPLRDTLFDTIMSESYKASSSTVRDNDLIEELCTLVEKNNRIDHTSSGKSDHVISWLICNWFLRQARNMSHYGIDPRKVMSKMEFTGEDGDSPEKRREAARKAKILDNIKTLEDMLDKSNSQMEKQYYISRLVSLRIDLGEEVTEDVTSVDKSLATSKDRRSRNSSYQGGAGAESSYFSSFRAGLGI